MRSKIIIFLLLGTSILYAQTIKRPPTRVIAPDLRADLTVVRLELYPYNPPASDEVRAEVCILNRGLGRSFIPNGHTIYSLESPGRPIYKYRDQSGGVWFEPGLTLCFNCGLGRMNRLGPGTHDFVFTSDPDNKVAEGDERNNRLEYTLTVLPDDRPDLLPDLIISSAAAEQPLATGFPRTVKFRVEVTNKGQASAVVQKDISIVSPEPTFYPALSAGETIAAGASCIFRLETRVPSAGTYTWTFKVDSVGAIREADEKNNTTQITVRVE